jgi:hypothetical protein
LERITFDKTGQLAMAFPFMRLPGELRNSIYHFHFDTTFKEQGLYGDAFCRRVESLKPALAILQVSHIIKHEASPIFWIDYAQRSHWSFGAGRDDDSDRPVKFCESARRYTIDVNITFQKRHLNTTSLSTNVVWLVLYSALDLPSDDVALQKLQEEWHVKHQNSTGFVWMKRVDTNLRENAIAMNYTYHQDGPAWAQFRGCLAMVDWGRILPWRLRMQTLCSVDQAAYPEIVRCRSMASLGGSFDALLSHGWRGLYKR